MLPQSIKSHLEKELKIQIETTTPLGGGDISSAYLISDSKFQFFLKLNNSKGAYNMFRVEANGLDILRGARSINIPKVVSLGEKQGKAYLVLEFIKSGHRTPKFWERFGQQLALLHQNHKEKYGLDHNNIIGSLEQSNQNKEDWIDFYCSERLLPQINLAKAKGVWSGRDLKEFDLLFDKLGSLLSIEKPSLIHGDLWSGNFICSNNEIPYLIDPAVCYAHREMDLAMSHLFGGFDWRFYRTYEESYPLEPGFSDRMALYQLYYLLVHVNLFGGGYVNQVRATLNRYL